MDRFLAELHKAITDGVRKTTTAKVQVVWKPARL
jgi:hypothetical protein